MLYEKKHEIVLKLCIDIKSQVYMYSFKSRPIRKVDAPVVLGGRTHLAVSCSPPLAPDMSTKLPAEDMENVTEGLLSKRLLEPLQLLVLKSLLRRILSEPFLDFPGTFRVFSPPLAAERCVRVALRSGRAFGVDAWLEHGVPWLGSAWDRTSGVSLSLAGA